MLFLCLIVYLCFSFVIRTFHDSSILISFLFFFLFTLAALFTFVVVFISLAFSIYTFRTPIDGVLPSCLVYCVDFATLLVAVLMFLVVVAMRVAAFVPNVPHHKLRKSAPSEQHNHSPEDMTLLVTPIKSVHNLTRKV